MTSDIVPNQQFVLLTFLRVTPQLNEAQSDQSAYFFMVFQLKT